MITKGMLDAGINAAREYVNSQICETNNKCTKRNTRDESLEDKRKMRELVQAIYEACEKAK